MVYNLDFSKFKGTFNPEISPVNPGENLKLRSLQKSDYDKGEFIKSRFLKNIDLEFTYEL